MTPATIDAAKKKTINWPSSSRARNRSTDDFKRAANTGRRREGNVTPTNGVSRARPTTHITNPLAAARPRPK